MNILKNATAIILLLLIIVSSCQDDDICVDETTPNLVVVILDNNDPTVRKTLDTIYVEYLLSDNEKDTLKLTATDSFQIPLRIDEGAIGFGFITSLLNNKDSVSMNYVPNQQYVSKACGLKRTFLDVEYTIEQQPSLLNLEVNQTQITNDNEIHLYLYY